MAALIYRGMASILDVKVGTHVAFNWPNITFCIGWYGKLLTASTISHQTEYPIIFAKQRANPINYRQVSYISQFQRPQILWLYPQG